LFRKRILRGRRLSALYNAFAETTNIPMYAGFVQLKCNRSTVNVMSRSKTVEFAAYVGIDWADRKHDICLQVADRTEREYLVVTSSSRLDPPC